MTPRDQRLPRRPYRTPEVIEIPLRPEEAVLGNCKGTVTSGPAQATCAVPSACSASGS